MNRPLDLLLAGILVIIASCTLSVTSASAQVNDPSDFSIPYSSGGYNSFDSVRPSDPFSQDRANQYRHSQEQEPCRDPWSSDQSHTPSDQWNTPGRGDPWAAPAAPQNKDFTIYTPNGRQMLCTSNGTTISCL